MTERANEIIICIQNNLDSTNIFNYDDTVNNIINDVVEKLKEYPIEQKLILEKVGDILYIELFDIYETALRDKTKWNGYFNQKINQLRPVASIDNKTLNPSEQNTGEEKI